ncbi:rod shape-determining protein MreC [Candidatus Cyanaurora vandensis]|uniref:rod shape-determining protein MreC n=1 Tax=Candidatus Cyanaurora vandensis TaxID=2714958 RepID=UPI0025802B81|nr:rod shape-determining protein MreC [Candidatus Cyanaurora vandensis]
MRAGLLRWWGRYQWQVVGTLVLLLAALYIRQTQAQVLTDVWYWLNWPLVGLEVVPPPNLSTYRTLELEQRLTSLEQENERLRTMLAVPVTPQSKPVAAQVIGRNGDHWWRTLVLNRGTTDGVALGNPVTAPGGLIGEVVAVSDRTARVLLVSDPLSKVGVQVNRTGAMGVVTGTYRSEGILEFFDSQSQVKLGDTVVTSGLSSRFPGNLPVGKISRLPDKRTEVLQATVQFTAPLDGLQWAFIHTGVVSRPLPDALTP